VILLNSQKPERCILSLSVDRSFTEVFLLCWILFICSKLCKKTGQTTEEYYNVLKVSIANLNFLWLQANLSFTPKLHSTLEHSLDHMEYFNRIEGMLEDDVEHIKQIAAKIKARVSQMKNKVLKEMYIQKLRPCSDLF
jgi:hypothetical protein